MKLWLISQTENDEYGTFDCAVVAAETEGEAKQIHPILSWGEDFSEVWGSTFSTWASSPENVTAKCIGTADDGIAAMTVICASFNAG